MLLDLDAIRAAPSTRDPSMFTVVKNVVRTADAAAVQADFPGVADSEESPYAALRAGPKFRQFVEEMQSKEVRRAFSEKFGVELVGGSQTITVRGRSALVDAEIPDDGEAGVITVLFYFDDPAEPRCGRLSGQCSSTESAGGTAETSPGLGTMIVFRRSDRFNHSPDLYRSARRYLTITWATNNSAVEGMLFPPLFSTRIQPGASLFEPTTSKAADARV
jgi:hypothetical protein